MTVGTLAGGLSAWHRVEAQSMLMAKRENVSVLGGQCEQPKEGRRAREGDV